jgi:hypothetical protein
MQKPFDLPPNNLKLLLDKELEEISKPWPTIPTAD